MAEAHVEHVEHVGPETLDPDAVHRVTSQVDLERVRLVYLFSLVLPDAADVAEDWGVDAYIGYDTHARWEDDTEGKFAAHPTFFLVYDSSWPKSGEGRPPERDPESPPEIEVEAMFELSYSLRDPTGISERDLEHFAFYNATFNAWPYWRELVQGLTQRMALRPLTVPVFRVPDLSKPPETDTAKKSKPQRTIKTRKSAAKK